MALMALARACSAIQEDLPLQDLPEPKRDPVGWEEFLHDPKSVKFVLDLAVDKQIKGDTVILEDVGQAVQAWTPYAKLNWVFGVKFHRNNKTAATELAFIVLTPAPKTTIQVILIGTPNL